MKYLIGFVVAVMLSACATSPQSRDELKSAARAHPTAMIYASYTSKRRFEDVIATLELKWNECYGISKSTTRYGNGDAAQFRDTLHPRIDKVNGFLVEMTLQVSREGMARLGKVPEGGDYMVALDVERLLGAKTRLTWHSATAGWQEQWELNKQWSDGKEAACL